MFDLKTLTKSFVLSSAFVTGISLSGLTANAQTLQDVLNAIHKESDELTDESERRLREFREQRDAQSAILSSTRTALNAANARNRAFNAQYDQNNAVLDELQQQLLAELGDFGELVDQFRTASGEISPVFNSSIISAEHPGRSEALAAISKAKTTLPTRQELDTLWQAMMVEMLAQSEVRSFTATVSNAGGKGEDADVEVFRIGPFTAATTEDTKFVEMSRELAQLTAFQTQPSGGSISGMGTLINSESGKLVRAPIDPERGDLLGLLSDVPRFGDRIQQGGLPGYVIIFLLFVGVSLGLFKLVSLFLMGNAVRKTAITGDETGNNPLANILRTYNAHRNDDVETLELQIDAAILKELPKIERFNDIIKVLAAIAPLLGLLGTVVGMIKTFTQITLHGAGDPKLMAGGISQALVTTVEGLAAAIPLVLIHALCAGSSRNIQQILDEQSAGLIADKAENRA